MQSLMKILLWFLVSTDISVEPKADKPLYLQMDPDLIAKKMYK